MLAITTSLFLHPAEAQFNPQINYQGKLTSPTSLAVPDGLYTLEFKLYTSPSGGSPLWSETRTGVNRVTVTNGLFSVMLGEVNPLTGVDFDQTLYLGVKIESDAEMSPRKILGTVPSAFIAATANNANTLGGVASTSFLRSDQADTASGLLTFSNGFLSTASSTISALTTTIATTTTLVINNQAVTSLTGTGLTINSGVLTVSTSSLTNLNAVTLNNQAGSYYLSRANHTGTQTAGTISDFNTTARGLLSSTATGLTYTSGTGIFSLTAGYSIPLTASTTNWNTFYNTPSNRIAAGTGMSWSGNTLNSVFTTSGSNIYNNNAGNVGIGTTTPSEKLTVAGNLALASNSDTFSIAGTRLVYFPDQTNFSGSLFIGNGGGSLSHSAGSEGYNNTAVGLSALNANTTGSQNTAIGRNSLRDNTTGSYNTASGVYSLQANTTGSYNTASGIYSLQFNTTGSYNTAFGGNSLQANTTGDSNTALGRSSLNANTTGSYNTAFGNNSLLTNTTGSFNTAIGRSSIFANTTGSYNTALGYNAGYDIDTATSTGANTIIGYSTGRGIVTGVNNTILGANVTGLSSTLSNNIIIADGAGNRRINVDSSGNVGIGTTTPGSKLTVAGDLNLTGAIQTNGNAGSNGQILQTTGAGTTWVATSTLGFTTGTVTSVGASGGTTGLSFANSPITSSGTMTMSGVLNLTSGGTGATTASGTRTNLGATTLGDNLFTMSNPSAITFLRVNANNTVSALNATDFRTAIGAGTGNGTVTSITAGTGLSGGTITATGTIALTGQALALHNLATNGLIARTGAGTVTARTLTGGTGVSVTNGDGVSGNPTVSFATTGTGAPFIQGGNAFGALATLGTTDNQALRFLTNNTESMRILPNGNVGIGTTTPSSKLTVAGDFFLTGSFKDSTNSAGTAGMILKTTGAGTTWVATSSLGLSSTFSNSAQLAALLSDETGSAGGGLAVFSASPTFTGTINAAAATLSSSLTMSGSVANIILGDNYLSSSGNDEGLYVGPTGFVGIDGAGGNFSGGGWKPNATLHINAPVLASGSTTVSQLADYTLLLNCNVQGLDCVSMTRVAGLAVKKNSSDQDRRDVLMIGEDFMFLRASSTTPYAVFKASSGNLGLGTTTPGSRLTVAGNIALASSSDTISIAGTQMVYLPDQTAFTGSLIIGDGGRNLSRGSGNDGRLNTGVGIGALASTTTGYSNTALGMRALYSNTAGFSNTALGFEALSSNADGFFNTANGGQALLSNTTGYNNTANGYAALSSNTIGDENTAVGFNALSSNTTGSGNTALGYLAGYEINTATSTGSNTLIGYNTGRGITTGVNNTIIGANVTGLASTLSNNIIIADGAGNQRINVDGSGNVGIGTTTPGSKLTVAGNIALASSSDTISIAGTQMVYLPDQTQFKGSLFIGDGGRNLSRSSGDQGRYNTGVGIGALASATTGYRNTAIGRDALLSNTTGYNNTANGDKALQENTTGNRNTANGGQALLSNTIGHENTAVGFNALFSNTTGDRNTALGYLAGYEINTATSTGSNTLIGYNTGRGITTGVNNTIIGANVTGLASTLSNNIIIADGAGNQRINVDGSGNVGIGTAVPQSLLHVYKSATTGTAPIAMLTLQLSHDGADTNAGEGPSIDFLVADSTGTSVIGNSNLAGQIAVVKSTNTDSNGAGEMTFSTALNAASLVEAMRITAAGNVGIGTTTPGSKLTVAGNIALASSSDTISIAGTQMVYFPDQTNFSGSLFIGNGGGSLSHSAGSEGYNNTAVGLSALNANTTGSQNTAIGRNSLSSNTTGSQNTALGQASLNTNTTGSQNTAIGRISLYSNTTGSYNTALGQASLNANTTGSYNTAFGYNAGYDIDTATSTGANTLIGYNTGRGITTGVNNTILGANVTGLASTTANNIIIADGAGNRRINVDNNGNVGIGDTTPTEASLVIGSAGAGNIYLTLDTAGTTNSAVCWDNAGATLLYDCDGTPADYAEFYPTQANVDFGHIVMTTAEMITQTDNTKVPLLGKAKVDGGHIIGITSNNYHDFTSAGSDLIDPSNHPLPVALNGRVPVKVNLEGGPINIGDAITISSVPGVGKKVEYSGETVVGIALDKFTATSVGDEVLVFVTNETHLSIKDRLRARLMDVDLSQTNAFAELSTDTTDTIWNRLTKLAKGFVNGILEVVGIRTQEICLTDGAGQTCIDRTQLNSLLNGSNNSAGTNNSGGTGGGDTTTDNNPGQPDDTSASSSVPSTDDTTDSEGVASSTDDTDTSTTTDDSGSNDSGGDNTSSTGGENTPPPPAENSGTGNTTETETGSGANPPNSGINNP